VQEQMSPGLKIHARLMILEKVGSFRAEKSMGVRLKNAFLHTFAMI
jgi:hypothetical protein